MVDTLKDKWGREFDITRFEDAGYGAFKKWVQKNVDEDWGKGELKDLGKKKYAVSMTAKTIISADTYVYAENEEEAKKLAMRKDVSWDIVDYDNIEDIECEVEEAEDED